MYIFNPAAGRRMGQFNQNGLKAWVNPVLFVPIQFYGQIV